MIRPSKLLLSELPLENIGATVGAAAVAPKFRFIPVVEKLKRVMLVKLCGNFGFEAVSGYEDITR